MTAQTRGGRKQQCDPLSETQGSEFSRGRNSKKVNAGSVLHTVMGSRESGCVYVFNSRLVTAEVVLVRRKVRRTFRRRQTEMRENSELIWEGICEKA